MLTRDVHIPSIANRDMKLNLMLQTVLTVVPVPTSFLLLLIFKLWEAFDYSVINSQIRGNMWLAP